MNIKGSLPLLILHILTRGPKHGYQIAKEIKESSKEVLDFAEGTLYPTLHDLEKRELIEAFEEEVRGRKRRCYRLTEAGRKQLTEERKHWKEYVQVVNLILGEASS